MEKDRHTLPIEMWIKEGAAWRSWCENKLIGGISVAGSVIHTTPYTPGHLLTAVFWLLLWVCSFTVVGFAKQD